MVHVIIEDGGNGTRAICGRRLTQAGTPGHSFYSSDERKLSKGERRGDLDCPFCLLVAKKLAQGVVFSYAIKETRAALAASS